MITITGGCSWIGGAPGGKRNPARCFHLSLLPDIRTTGGGIAAKTTVVLPLHPRTAKVLAANDIDTSRLTIIPPASYLETLSLEKHARVILTDSGGVQKEAFFLERPCIILRDETEWVEIVQNGAGILAGACREDILSAYGALCGRKVAFPPVFGDGHAASHILDAILASISPFIR